MDLKTIKQLFIIVAFTLLLMTACSPSSSDTTNTDNTNTENTDANGANADEVAIYSAVVRQIVTTDDTFGGTLGKPVVYINSQTDDATGDPAQGSSESVTLSPEVQAGITAALSDLPSTITWVESRDALEFDENGSITGGGVLITLGNIHPQESDAVHVGGSIYVGSLAAGGKTYVLENQDGAWAITGTTGMEWIS